MTVKSSQPLLTRGMGPKRTLTIIFGMLHALAYAVWFGGIIAIGALVAPSVAHALHNPPAHINAGVLRGVLTTQVIGESLRHFLVVTYICATTMILADIVEMAVYPGVTARLTVIGRLAVTIVLFVSALYLGMSVTPRMDALLADPIVKTYFGSGSEPLQLVDAKVDRRVLESRSTSH